MVVLDSTVVNIALPSIGRELSDGISGLQRWEIAVGTVPAGVGAGIAGPAIPDGAAAGDSR
jgi:hypothetical protein